MLRMCVATTNEKTRKWDFLSVFACAKQLVGFCHKFFFLFDGLQESCVVVRVQVFVKDCCYVD